VLENIIQFLAGMIIQVIDAIGYVGVALLMAIESACIPLPSEIIMPFAGYLAHTGRFDLIWVATAGAIGCNIGSAIAYAVGATGGRKAVEKWGRYVLLSTTDLDLAERFFGRFGSITVFLSRLLPVVRTFIALPAGIARMNVWRFHLYTFLGSWPWCFGLAYIGGVLGERWESDPALKTILHRFDAVIILVILAGAAWFIRSRWRHRIQAG
jgi:membrane protein DedA with SNARE-associated domain